MRGEEPGAFQAVLHDLAHALVVDARDDCADESEGGDPENAAVRLQLLVGEESEAQRLGRNPAVHSQVVENVS